MSLKALAGLLKQAPQFQQLQRSLSRSRGRARAQALPNAVPFALAALWQELRAPTLVVAPRPEDARRLHEQLQLWSGDEDNVLHFPESEALPFERLVADADITHQRLRTLARLGGQVWGVGYQGLGIRGQGSGEEPPLGLPLAKGEIRGGSSPVLVVASVAAVVQRTIDRQSFVSASHTLHRNEEIDLEDLLDTWRRMGYAFETTVVVPGTASRRGGILDVFPVGASLPARIELWGNEIDSIRLFDPATQRSQDMVDSITIIPAQETLPGMTEREELDRLLGGIDLSNCDEANRDRIREEMGLLLEGYDEQVEELNFYAGFFNRGSLLDYFPEDGLIVMYRPADIAEAAWDTEERGIELRQAKEERGELPYNFPSSYMAWREAEEKMEQVARRLDVMPWGADDLIQQDIAILPFSSPPAFLGKTDSFADEVRELARDSHRVVAMTSHSKRLCEILADYGIGADNPATLEAVPGPGSVTVLHQEGAGLQEGLVLTTGRHRLVVFSDAEIFGVAKQRRVRRRTTAMRRAFFEELRLGDYVVHVEHGIGRFMGAGRMDGATDDTEYMILQYAQGDKLYVPMEHLDRVTPYVAPSDQPPRLTRLGTPEWRRARERVERSTREMAAELLSLYAARELAEGHAFAPDAPWQAELEESFPFEETPDQVTTLGEVKSDMEASRPMDRLVCGDVGYGKTEIALRAAFKAVLDGKQVAVLVPTTVLAQQHYVTFTSRMKAFPTRIEVLSRFRTDKEQEDILRGLADGTIDICIGTHRLIQKDVKFKDLGLVVVDEEQRFGVAHKEYLKQLRREVDVLTLTATPIPRTLHMAMAGVRDMSVVNTPPEERLPIKTYVSEFSDELIREAILRELDRQGQVYFLHNRVYNIDYMADYIHRLVPEADVGVAHGQMPEGQLEQTMLDFADGRMDVLVCTTIIESGLDIPNVNTLIINRADTFGLAQLYQLRGRVGRSSRRAYAYLLVPKAKSITETAEKRLKALLAATELGAGFRIAMKDLEIRGAGNILGAEQSGHIEAVGFDLYTRLLAHAVEELRAQRAIGNGMGGQAIAPAVDEEGQSLALPEAKEPDPNIDLGIPASITQDYVPDLTTRLGIYQRLVQLERVEDVEAMEDELRDRFGPLPWQVENLLYVLRLKIRAKQAGVDSITREDGRLVLRLKYDIGGARRALQRTLGSEADMGNTQIRLPLEGHAEGWEKPLLDTVAKLAAFREQMLASVGAVR